MIADVSPNEIISITKRSGRSRPLSSSAQAQSVVDALGTNLNIQLSKVANAGRIIFVEGGDHAFLDQIAFKFGNAFYDKFSRLPHFAVGGLNNWRRAATTSQAFHETSSGKVCSIIFLDRDYKSDAFFEELSKDAEKQNLQINVWRRKEIENFFLDEDLIFSYIESRSAIAVSDDEVSDMVRSVVDVLVADLPIMVADSMQAADRKIALPTAMKKAAAFLDEQYAVGVSPRDLVSGKKAISQISAAAQDKWNVQISPMALCRHLEVNSIPTELKEAVLSLV